MEKCSGKSDQNDRQIPAYMYPVRVWAGNGTGATCSFCGYSIQAHEIEYEIEPSLPSTEGILRFHFRCHRRWEGQSRPVDQP
jgi:hypothetical protein